MAGKPHPNPAGHGGGKPHGQILPRPGDQPPEPDPHGPGTPRPPVHPGNGGGNGNGGGGGGLNHNQQNAFDYFMSVLQSYGLDGFSEIAKVVRKAIIDGITDPNQLDLLVRNTDAWHQRFAGNDILTQNGGNALSVAEYLSTETAYRQIMSQAGLPKGFYDDPSDFAQFIGQSKSPAEIQSRVAAATDLMRRNGDDALQAQLASMGMDPGHILARYLDPTKAEPLLQRDYQTALIGAAARRVGTTADNSYAQHLADIGVTEGAAIQGYGQVADITPALERLGNVYGDQYTQSDAEKEIFEGAPGDKRRRLSSQERGSFSGSSGTSQGSLSKPASGSY